MGSAVAALTDSSMASGWIAVTALALVAIVGIVHLWRTNARIARRTAALETELLERRRIEAQLESAQRELEERVRQRTQALEARNEELTQLRITLETANQRLRRLVTIDALTGVANRRHFDRSLERELRRTRRDEQPLSLIFLDLDEFKRFNDTYGHAHGDEVLRQVAQTLNETFRRGGDFVARYGGEEFAVVLPGVDARRAALYAERLRRRIWRQAIPYAAAHSTGRVTISGGVATVAPPMIATAEELLRAADKALYRAKCLGRNQIASAPVETGLAQPAKASGL
ncbi:diguanylate cyclase (GGDEF)-like protein [Povalibacter uvarum]|uniref:diguanylate cyclase n=1 Tax=Povalibacter uvarum TaxID=732238 RepID=A0A841HMX6_9GAMM|nr:diguanylate cyclase [Povalibacter uvarum]MBB6093432.1 diguanylate cyclase (GGDEF)-like protein [Povalibacter uvarum]